MAGLVWAARRLPRRHADDDPRDARIPSSRTPQLLLFAAAILACVVTSPAGWVMSFVWALPIAPLVWTRARRGRALPRRLARLLGGAWIACALSPLIAAGPRVAGTALVVAAVRRHARGARAHDRARGQRARCSP